ncbi:hypothetical protein V1509DRAFT_625091 [Lipomyces kononenkoae]
MSRYFAPVDYSSGQHDMLLFATAPGSMPSSGGGDYAFVDQFSLAPSPASSMSPTSFPLDPITVSGGHGGINPRMFISRSLLEEQQEEEEDTINNNSTIDLAHSAPAPAVFADFQFRPQPSSSVTSEPSPSSSSSPSATGNGGGGPRLVNPKRAQQASASASATRRPALTSSRSAPAVAQCAAAGPTKNAAGKFQCTECTRSYLHAKHLKRHMLRHTGDRPYKCSLCSDSFCRSDILKRHFEKCQHRRANAAKAAAASRNNMVPDDRSESEMACDECLRTGLRCGREDGNVCLRCGQLGSPCSVAGMLVDEPGQQSNNTSNTTPSPPTPAPASMPMQMPMPIPMPVSVPQPHQQHEYFPKPQIDDESSATGGVFAVSTEFQQPFVQPYMYDYNLLSYYPDMVDSSPASQVHVQSPMQFYA